MQTKSMPGAYRSKENLLRNTLRGNAAFSVVCGLLLSLASGPIANFMGFSAPVPLIIIGIGLFPFAYMVYRTAASQPMDVRGARIIIGLDAGWVVGSFIVLLLAWSQLTVGGRWLLVLQAEGVFLFGLFQAIGVRRLTRSVGS